MKKLYSMAIVAGLTLALSGCTASASNMTSLSTAHTDKDHDGVMDISDQCPNTVAGTTVSKDGCKIYTSVIDLDEKKLCDTKINGVKGVLATAIKYNKTAKEHGVEFKRQGSTTSDYIDAVKEAIASGKKIVHPKGDKTKKDFTVEYATQRACKFAIGALVLEAEGKNNWREAVPGDGFKY